jgi:hypothetical protein
VLNHRATSSPPPAYKFNERQLSHFIKFNPLSLVLTDSGNFNQRQLLLRVEFDNAFILLKEKTSK